MKKEFHGFKVEKVDVPIVNVIAASGNSCSYVYNYSKAPYGSGGRADCDLNEIEISPERTRPYYFGDAF